MPRRFLFGGNSTSQSENKYLVEFRAGKMTMKDKMVHPDKRKGLLFVHQTDDSLMHFCWKDRTSGTVEDDLIIFPEDVIFKRVPECTTGRVYVLKFKSSSRRCFYWLQEPKNDKDKELCCKVNQVLNNPPAGSSRSGTSSSGMGGSSTPSQGGGGLQSELSNLADGDLQNLLNNMSQQQLLQLLGVSNVTSGGVSNVTSLSSLLGASRPSSGQSTSSTSDSSRSTAETTQSATSTPLAVSSQASKPTTPAAAPTPAPVTASTTSSKPNSSIRLSDLQNILSGLNVPSQSEEAHGPSVDLSSAITAEALQPLFDNQELMERVQKLLPPSTEPETPIVSDQLRSTVQSPQFQQALSIFSAALQSGQLGPLMQQFGMAAEVVTAANSGDMDAFVRALQSSKQNAEGSESTTGESEGVADKEKDEEMNLD